MFPCIKFKKGEKIFTFTVNMPLHPSLLLENAEDVPDFHAFVLLKGEPF